MFLCQKWKHKRKVLYQTKIKVIVLVSSALFCSLSFAKILMARNDSTIDNRIHVYYYKLRQELQMPWFKGIIKIIKICGLFFNIWHNCNIGNCTNISLYRRDSGNLFVSFIIKCRLMYVPLFITSFVYI